MISLLRLIPLFVLLLVSQSGIATITTNNFTEHQYGVNYIALDEGIYDYDTNSNSQYCCQVHLDESTENRSFLVFASDFLATKSTGAFSKVAPATAKQLQKKFMHAGDFGVSGNYNPANAQKFNQAIQKHLNASGTKEIAGTYRGNSVTFHTNPNSGLTAIQNPNGSFLSGWKLNPQQLQHVLKDGKL